MTKMRESYNAFEAKYGTYEDFLYEEALIEMDTWHPKFGRPWFYRHTELPSKNGPVRKKGPYGGLVGQKGTRLYPAISFSWKGKAYKIQVGTLQLFKLNGRWPDEVNHLGDPRDNRPDMIEESDRSHNQKHRMYKPTESSPLPYVDSYVRSDGVRIYFPQVRGESLPGKRTEDKWKAFTTAMEYKVDELGHGPRDIDRRAVRLYEDYTGNELFGEKNEICQTT